MTIEINTSKVTEFLKRNVKVILPFAMLYVSYLFVLNIDESVFKAENIYFSLMAVFTGLGGVIPAVKLIHDVYCDHVQ